MCVYHGSAAALAILTRSFTMPYLFVVEKLGWRDDFNQAWEVTYFYTCFHSCKANPGLQGTGEDYSELPPRLERLLLPFPKSPLRHKNPEHPENVMPPPARF
jgi:hypothetical protein